MPPTFSFILIKIQTITNIFLIKWSERHKACVSRHYNRTLASIKHTLYNLFYVVHNSFRGNAHSRTKCMRVNYLKVSYCNDCGRRNPAVSVWYKNQTYILVTWRFLPSSWSDEINCNTCRKFTHGKYHPNVTAAVAQSCKRCLWGEGVFGLLVRGGKKQLLDYMLLLYYVMSLLEIISSFSGSVRKKHLLRVVCNESNICVAWRGWIVFFIKMVHICRNTPDILFSLFYWWLVTIGELFHTSTNTLFGLRAGGHWKAPIICGGIKGVKLKMH